MRTGLALSGGGAIGAAHLGVLEALEKEKIEVNYISGTSAGAIIALLYADGGLPALNRFFDELSESGLTKRSTILLKRNDTIFSMIESALRRIVKAQSFSELAIQFACISTDIIEGKPVVLRSGDPIKAVMASAAYPGVFSPQNVDGRLCVDGGLTINLPATVLREMGADFIIGSSLYGISKMEAAAEESMKLNLLATVFRSIDIMSKVIADQEIKSCQFCFEPPVETYKWYNFDKIFEIREIGRKFAQKVMPELRTAISRY